MTKVPKDKRGVQPVILPLDHPDPLSEFSPELPRLDFSGGTIVRRESGKRELPISRVVQKQPVATNTQSAAVPKWALGLFVSIGVVAGLLGGMRLIPRLSNISNQPPATPPASSAEVSSSPVATPALEQRSVSPIRAPPCARRRRVPA